MRSARSGAKASMLRIAISVVVVLPLMTATVSAAPTLAAAADQGIPTPSQPGNAATAQSAELRASALADRLHTECERFQAPVSAEDVEAAYAFVLSQSETTPADVTSAVRLLLALRTLPSACRVAASNLGAAWLNQGTRIGTGAIASAFGVGSSSFTSPMVTIGGGGSNYSS